MDLWKVVLDITSAGGDKSTPFLLTHSLLWTKHTHAYTHAWVCAGTIQAWPTTLVAWFTAPTLSSRSWLIAGPVAMFLDPQGLWTVAWMAPQLSFRQSINPVHRLRTEWVFACGLSLCMVGGKSLRNSEGKSLDLISNQAVFSTKTCKKRLFLFLISSTWLGGGWGVEINKTSFSVFWQVNSFRRGQCACSHMIMDQFWKGNHVTLYCYFILSILDFQLQGIRIHC